MERPQLGKNFFACPWCHREIPMTRAGRSHKCTAMIPDVMIMIGAFVCAALVGLWLSGYWSG